ncbi:MAG: hypothetical protein HY819_17515 [Acidobacteria bacterium]|nr:hypothetical protein [Acidobacteriota bacterium]
MVIDLKKLDILKEKIITATNFREPWDYFFDNFAENNQFLDIGKKVKYPELAKMLEKVSQQLLDNPSKKASSMLLVEIPKRNFYHGGYFIDNKLANFIFFKDIDKGMIAITSSFRSKEILFSRFSLLAIKSNTPIITPPSLN